MKIHRNTVAHLIATLGGSIILTELMRHWLHAHHMEGNVILVGAAFGFVGAYMSDPRRVIRGGSFLVDAAARILAVMPGSHRREGY